MIYKKKKKKRLKPNLALGQVRSVGSILTFPKLYPFLYSNHLTAKNLEWTVLVVIQSPLSQVTAWIYLIICLLGKIKLQPEFKKCCLGGMQLTLLIVSFQIKRIQNTQGKWKEISSLAFSSLYTNLFVCNSAIALLLLFFSSLHLRRRKRKNPFL